MHVPKLDTYQNLEILAAARSGARELRGVKEALAGKRPFGAQVRLLLELAARGHVDLAHLLASHRKVQP